MTIDRLWFGDAKPFLERFRQEADHLVVWCVSRAVVEDLATYAGVGVAERG